MADSFRVIVDNTPKAASNHGLPDAPRYYDVFPREPSPAGDMTVTRDQMSLLNDPTIKSVLDEMAKSVGSGGTVLIVCHSSTSGDGLFMPLVKGGPFSNADALDLVRKLAVADSLAAPVRLMSEKTPEDQAKKLNALLKIFSQFDPPFPVDGKVSLAEAKKGLDEWFNVQTRNLRISLPQLQGLITSLRAVQNLHLDRVEFRACDAGKKTQVMQTMKRFFGCKKLLAPKLETVFLPPIAVEGIPPLTTPAPRGTSAAPGPVGRPHPTARGRVPGPAGTTTAPAPTKERVGMLWVPTLWYRESTLIGKLPPGSKGRLLSVGGGSFGATMHSDVLLAIGEVPPKSGDDARTFQYRALAVTEGNPRGGRVVPDVRQIGAVLVKFILQSTIYPGRNFPGGKFPVAAFWNLDNEALPPFILPNEQTYLDQIAQV